MKYELTLWEVVSTILEDFVYNNKKSVKDCEEFDTCSLLRITVYYSTSMLPVGNAFQVHSALAEVRKQVNSNNNHLAVTAVPVTAIGSEGDCLFAVVATVHVEEAIQRENL